MEEITVNKAKLIETMKANREKHHEIVVEAQEGFRQKVIERLDELLELARDGRKINLHIGLAMPEDHTDEYDTVIGMLELDLDDTVLLDMSQYRQWVQDQWGWQRSFTTSNAVYSATAARNL